MANPQPDKFIRISIELFEAIMIQPFTRGERGIVDWVIRNTYGWNRKVALYEPCVIAYETGMSRRSVQRRVLDLESKKIIFRKGGKVGIQKDYEKWDGPSHPGLFNGRNPANNVGPSTYDRAVAYDRAVVGGYDKTGREVRQGCRSNPYSKDIIDIYADAKEKKPKGPKRPTNGNILPDPDLKPEKIDPVYVRRVISLFAERAGLVKANFSRNYKPARSILAEVGTVEKAGDAIRWVADEMEDQDLSWTLETVLKRLDYFLTSQAGNPRDTFEERVRKGVEGRKRWRDEN